MRVGSLFSGIGGLDLGLERAGMTVVWQSEIDPYACKVLAKHWPTVPNLGDITQVDWSSVEPVDLICGGYPCQPFALVGKRLGADDERYLWPLMRDAIRVLRPRYVIAENVSGHLGLGFDRVLADLAGLGFDADWSVVPACAMGAPHTRDRLFIVAYADSSRWDRWLGTNHAARWPTGWNEPARPDQSATWAQIPAPHLRGVAHGIPHRVDRLRCLGNAVVPQVAEHIGRLIMTADNPKPEVEG